MDDWYRSTDAEGNWDFEVNNTTGQWRGWYQDTLFSPDPFSHLPGYTVIWVYNDEALAFPA